MYKCNQCKAIFDSPAEAKREVEYYPRPFGNGSEPYGGGYYECCPECGSEDFDRFDEEEYIKDYIFDNEQFGTEEIICPYCKMKQEDVETTVLYSEKEDYELECDYCYRRFLLNSYCTFNCTTTPIESEIMRILKEQE